MHAGLARSGSGWRVWIAVLALAAAGAAITAAICYEEHAAAHDCVACQLRHQPAAELSGSLEIGFSDVSGPLEQAGESGCIGSGHSRSLSARCDVRSRDVPTLRIPAVARRWSTVTLMRNSAIVQLRYAGRMSTSPILRLIDLQPQWLGHPYHRDEPDAAGTVAPREYWPDASTPAAATGQRRTSAPRISILG